MTVNKRKKISAFILSYMICMIITMAFSNIVTYASEVDAGGTISSYVAENAPVYDSSGKVVKSATSKWTTQVSSYFSRKITTDKTKLATATYGDYTTTYYYSGSSEEKIASDINSIGTSDEVRQQVDDLTDGLGINADVQGATASIGGIIPWVNLATGVLVVAITAGMTLFTAGDISWLQFPVLHNMMQGAVDDGNGGALISKTSKATGEKKFRFVTDEAIKAYKESQVEGDKWGPYGKYLVKRLWVYIINAIMLAILLTGNISIFTNLGVQLVSGLLDVIKSLSMS